MKLINIAAAILLMTSCALAESSKEQFVGNDRSKAENDIDNKQKYLEAIDNGWARYYDSKNINPAEVSKEIQNSSTTDKTVVMLLSEILKTNKENLEVSKQILSVLQGEFAPVPKKMVVDGKECFENDSAKCYKMPAFTPEAKLLVYQKFRNNPGIQTAAEVIKWEDKHFWEIRKSAHLREQALAQFSDEIRPMNGLNRVDYRDSAGKYDDLVGEAYMKAIFKLSAKYSYDIYFGDNDPENMYFLSAAKRFYKEFEKYGKPPVRFVFNNQKSANIIKEIITTLNRGGLESKTNPEYIILSKEEYAKRNIKTTPSLVVHDKKDNKIQTLSGGQASSTSMMKKVKDYLLVKEELKDSDMSDYKVIGNNKEFMLEKAEDKFGLSPSEKKSVERIIK